MINREQLSDYVEPLANELARVRQRGIDHLDRAQGRQRPVVTPVLDDLAGVGLPLSRAEQIRMFLHKRLISYAEMHELEAVFVQRLLFDENGHTPGHVGPSGLLRKARSEHNLTDESFRKLQRQQFLDFAHYLLMLEAPPTPAHTWSVIKMAIVLVMLAILIAVPLAVWLIAIT